MVLLPAEQVSGLSSVGRGAFRARGQFPAGEAARSRAIACGLPVIAYAGSGNSAAHHDAGVVLGIPTGTKLNLAKRWCASCRMRSSGPLLAERSRRAYRKHFTWEAIAARYIDSFSEQS